MGHRLYPDIQRDRKASPPMLVVRVETDSSYTKQSSATCCSQGKESPGQRTMPIGQVFFVPREEITLADSTGDELEAMRGSRRRVQPREGGRPNHDPLRHPV